MMEATLKPYPEYQDTGHDWLGQVPAHWAVLPNGALFREVKDQNHPEEPLLSVTIARGVIFQLAHVVEGPDCPAPDERGLMEHAWLIHEMHTTANFAAENHLLSWYIGGLNYQIEHHLFPQVCSVHYPALSPIVREVAREHGVPYHYNPRLVAAMRSHQRRLKELGRMGAPIEDVRAG